MKNNRFLNWIKLNWLKALFIIIAVALSVWVIIGFNLILLVLFGLGLGIVGIFCIIRLFFWWL